ncbi:MAG: methionyl-tRNA formyltransferase, partial [Methylococcales bacterium]|nr:methionyl-tRNA formyltransferase [Methylococcales bacterium]
VVGVFTQPDRIAGRGKKVQQSPVKQCAVQAGIDVFQPQSFKQASARKMLDGLQADLMIVVAYGLILPQSVLNIPTLGCINAHASLLPRWRGAAPIQRAIEAGDAQTGVCLMQMDKGLDTGPVFACHAHQISPTETGGMLHDALSSLGADLLRDKLDDILNRNIQPKTQSTNDVSYAHKLSKDETRLQWHLSAAQLANKIRAFTPWPVMTTNIDGQVIRLHQANVVADTNRSDSQAGEITALSAKGIEVQTGDGKLIITQLQKPGGKILSTRDFLNGFRLSPGQRFE